MSYVLKYLVRPSLLLMVRMMYTFLLMIGTIFDHAIYIISLITVLCLRFTCKTE